MSRTLSRRRRDKVLQEQGRRCACCKAYTPTTAEAALDSVQNRMLCKQCMILIGNVRSSLERGVTFATVMDYFETGARDVVQIEGDTTSHENKVAGREAVAQGKVPGMTLAQYDAMTGQEPEQEEVTEQEEPEQEEVTE